MATVTVTFSTGETETYDVGSDENAERIAVNLGIEYGD